MSFQLCLSCYATALEVQPCAIPVLHILHLDQVQFYRYGLFWTLVPFQLQLVFCPCRAAEVEGSQATWTGLCAKSLYCFWTPKPKLDIICAFSLCLDLGLGALKVPKESDEGGRATGSTRKGKRQHSSPQNLLLDCSLCGKVFSSASSLSKHYLTHSQERKHVCKVCSKAFKRQDHLYVKSLLVRRRAGGMHCLSLMLLSTHPVLSFVELPPLWYPDVCSLSSGMDSVLFTLLLSGAGLFTEPPNLYQ